jgi:glycogen phosphorylase
MTEQLGLTSEMLPLLKAEIAGFELLAELALDLHSSWHHGADYLWNRIDRELWEMTLNPWVVLKSASQEKIEELLRDTEFRLRLNEQIERRRKKIASPSWFQNTYPHSKLSSVAYLSMEYMLSEALPIYSGGLGNVAGDQLKSANDLGVPVVAVGLLYSQGYFRQVIDKNGNQQALFPYNDPGQLPVIPLRDKAGKWIRLKIDLPGWPLWLRTWQAIVGSVRLLLLDSNDIANYPPHRGITSELYGGDSEMRLKQEIILGIGGARLLDQLGIMPEVYHLNEGHAAFATLERACLAMQRQKINFYEALTLTRAGNLFTTHTAVPAGFDRFSPVLIEQYLGSYVKNKLGISLHELLALGRQNPNDASEYFNMAYLAVRCAKDVNAVSALHEKVSKHIFAPLFPRLPENEVPIGHITNGVHMATWDSPAADALWTECCGQARWQDSIEHLKELIYSLSDEKIWQMRNDSRKMLIDRARVRLIKQLEARGVETDEVERVKYLFDPHVLTIGFARRFAGYKRPNLLLKNWDRLLAILNNTQKPVQLVIAGKAHPEDKIGQEMIQDWMRFIKRPDARHRIIFLSDYDIRISELLVQGVDLWLNTPRRPWEACGTSGMKVLVNGGLNLSELDGWWAEAYNPNIGWAIGDGKEHTNDEEIDKKEAEELYTLLEKEIVPCFYTRNEKNIPEAWISRCRQSMAELALRYSSNRAVREYTDTYYVPLAKAYLERRGDEAHGAKKIASTILLLKEKWSQLRFGKTTVKTVAKEHYFEVELYLGELDPGYLQVELYADPNDNKEALKIEMKCERLTSNKNEPALFTSKVITDRPKSDFTPRVLPHIPGAELPLECPLITWAGL